MNIKCFISLFMLLFTFIAANAQKADRTFIDDVVEKYQKQSSMSYDIDYKIKIFDDEDTLKIGRHCNLIRDLKDTIFGGYIWYDKINNVDDNSSKYFDLRYTYFIDHDKKAITRHSMKQGGNYVISSNFDGEVINIKYLKPELINDKVNQVVISDTLIHNKKFVSVYIKFPDNDETTNEWINFFINKKTKNIEKITYSCDIKDQNQYNEWNLSNIKFNTVTVKDLEKKLADLQLTYPLTDFKEPTAEDRALLVNGSSAPVFTAKSFIDDVAINSNNYKGKILILDFWYMGCYPCALAVPHLNAIQERFKDDVVVLGVNLYDVTEKALKKIPDYIKRNDLKYTIASIDQSVAKEFNVMSYPTLYIIDKNGLIHYSTIGFSDNLEKELEEIITKMLSK